MSKVPIKKDEILKVYTDGAARGNPGPAAYAFLFIHHDTIIHKGSGFIGLATNNTAEYKAIINALRAAKKFQMGHLQIFSDSNLAVQQINRKWKINYPHLSELFIKVHHLCERFERVEFHHVSRNNRYLQICDELCNSQLDRQPNYQFFY